MVSLLVNVYLCLCEWAHSATRSFCMDFSNDVHPFGYSKFLYMVWEKAPRCWFQLLRNSYQLVLADIHNHFCGPWGKEAHEKSLYALLSISFLLSPSYQVNVKLHIQWWWFFREWILLYHYASWSISALLLGYCFLSVENNYTIEECNEEEIRKQQ